MGLSVDPSLLINLSRGQRNILTPNIQWFLLPEDRELQLHSLLLASEGCSLVESGVSVNQLRTTHSVLAGGRHLHAWVKINIKVCPSIDHLLSNQSDITTSFEVKALSFLP